MKKTEYTFAESAASLRALERQAERERARYIAARVGAAWAAFAGLFRGQRAQERQSA